jgi:DNA-binding CsgD family transcriptional regulator
VLPVLERRARRDPQSLLLMRMLDEIDYGLMLVDPPGRVRYANQAALHECNGRHALSVDAGQLTARTLREREVLARSLESAAQGRRSLLSLHSDGASLTAAVVPMGSDSSDEPSVLIVFGKRQMCGHLSVEFFAQAHRLTAAECAVLKGLTEGLKPSQIAAQVGVAISTVRSQIGSIRIKTATKSIRDLVNQVALMPPFVPVLNKGSPYAGL